MRIKQTKKLISFLFPLSIGILFAVIPFTLLQIKKATPVEAGWFTGGSNGEWTFRQKLTINSSYVDDTGAADLSDFPIVYNKVNPYLVGKTQSAGQDIVFTSSDGITQLDHEIEEFDTQTGKLVAWIRIPTLDYNNDTTIYLYYGNKNTTDMQDANGTWYTDGDGDTISDYKAVLHMNQDPTTAVLDSTSFGNNGTSAGSMTSGDLEEGAIGKSIDFDGSDDYLNVGNDASLNIGTKDFSVLTWIKEMPVADGYFEWVSSKNSGAIPNNGSVGFQMGWRDDCCGDSMQFRFNDGQTGCGGSCGESVVNTTDTDDDTWRLVAFSADRSSNGALYVDGTVSSGSISARSGSLTTTAELIIAGNSGGAPSASFTGNIDEYRFIVGTAISAQYVNTTYNNVKFQSTFIYASGSETKKEHPILFLKLDEGTGNTVSDTSYYANSGTRTGATWLTSGCADINCLSFDNSGDYITIADNLELDFNNRDFTISGWIYRSSSSVADDTIIAKRNGNTNSDQGYIAYIRDGDDRLVFEACDATSSCDEYSLISTSTIPNDTWTHFAIVWDDDSAINSEIYINGLDDDPDNNNDVGTIGNIGDLSNALSLVIGAESDFGSPFYGRLDEIKTYAYARTPEEILSEYNLPSTEEGTNIGVSGADLPSPAGYWKMDEGYGDTAYNATSNTGINGNLGGGTACPATGACPVQSLSGKFDKALSFDGSDDYVEVTAASSINLESKSGYSVCAWIKPTSTGEGSAGEFWSKGNSYLRISGGDVIGANFDLTTNDATYTTTKTVTLGSWSHVCATWSDDGDDELSIYINGENTGASSASGDGAPENDSGSNMFIGGDASNNFNGLIDNVRIYAQELTSAEVKSDMNYASATNFGTGTSERDQVEGADYTNDLGAYWNADENTGTVSYDKSGNGNTTDTFSTLWTPGRFGGAFAFDGTDDVIQITETSSTDKGTTTDSYTVTAWIKTNANYSGNAYVVAKNDGSGAYPFALYLNSSERACFQISDGTNSPSVCAITPTLSDGNWHNIAGKRSTTTDRIYIYIDGYLAAAATTDTTTATTINNDKITIGNGGASYTAFDFNGAIDEVKFFNSALTQAQIAQEVNRGAPIGWWKLDECTGTDINDSGTGANIGTLTVGGSGAYTSTGACNSGTASEFWYAGSAGKSNSAGAFETDDYITIANVNEIDFDLGLSAGMTFTAWVKPASDGELNMGEVFDKGTNNYCRTENEAVVNSITYVDITCNIDGSSDVNVTVANAMEINTWNHLALTISGNDANLYINGVLKDSGSGSGVPAGTDSSPLLIGGDTSHNFHGLLDDIRLYNYPLSANQVKSVLNGGSVNFRHD